MLNVINLKKIKLIENKKKAQDDEAKRQHAEDVVRCGGDRTKMSDNEQTKCNATDKKEKERKDMENQDKKDAERRKERDQEMEDDRRTKECSTFRKKMEYKKKYRAQYDEENQRK